MLDLPQVVSSGLPRLQLHPLQPAAETEHVTGERSTHSQRQPKVNRKSVQEAVTRDLPYRIITVGQLRSTVVIVAFPDFLRLRKVSCEHQH